MATARIGYSTRSRSVCDRGCPMGALIGRALTAALIVLVFAVSPAPAQDTRWVEVGGVANFRDMGGYPAGGGTVKRGVLFRSADLSKITGEGIRDFERLGVVTVVDLREGGDPSRLQELLGDSISVESLPMHADPLKDRNDYYKRMIVNSRQSLIGLLLLLAEEDNLPMVIFDEDGVHEVDAAAQLVLLTLGVSGPDVVSDYLLSNKYHALLKREWGEIIVRYFDEYGGMDYYTTKILGISSDQINRIRENLITQ